MVKGEKYREIYEKERGRKSVENVGMMFLERPWVKGEITETEQYCEEDSQGIDMFVPVDERLVDWLCLEKDSRGLAVQVKSSWYEESAFAKSHKKKIFDLGFGRTILVLNGQEEWSLMQASLLGQMVAMVRMTGIPEEVFLGFMADELGDKTLVEAYFRHRDCLVDEKWFGKRLTE